MVHLLTAEQMREMDRATIEDLGVPSMVLMETAGRAVAVAARELAEQTAGDGSVLLLVGLGNNGGDAVVAARHLANADVPVTLAIAGDPGRARGDLAAQLAIADKISLPTVTVHEDMADDDLDELVALHDVLVDGLFGTGLSRPVGGLPARLIDAVHRVAPPVVAIDIPSGVDADSGRVLGCAIEADITVTFAWPKIGHAVFPGRELCGDLRVVDIGIPNLLLERIEPAAEIVGPFEVDAAFPPRAEDAHKGAYGHLLVVAGTPDRPGSALLASRAALRVGTGLVTLGSDDETVRRLAPALEALMGQSLGHGAIDAGRLLEAVEERTALALGPSLVPGPALEALLRRVLIDAKVPVVLDAGALGALGADPSWLGARTFPTVLTPHPGEMARIVGCDTAAVQGDRLGVARGVAATTGAVVVLKGASTVIAEPDGRVGIVLAGNPGMATGGSGDVLTGVIGGLLAQGLPAARAARVGAWLHAEAGDRAAAAGGPIRLVASDLLDHLVHLVPEDAEDA